MPGPDIEPPFNSEDGRCPTCGALMLAGWQPCRPCRPVEPPSITPACLPEGVRAAQRRAEYMGRPIESPAITVPLDELHRHCMAARHAIRSHANGIRCMIAEWEPRPAPPQGT